MSTKHYKEQLSAFVDQEMSKEERQAVAEHLLVCEGCRREHDELKLGAGAATRLLKADAPNAVWNAIECELEGRAPHIEMIPDRKFFTLRNVAAFAGAITVVGLLSVLVYRGLLMDNAPQVAHSGEPNDSVAAQPKAGQPEVTLPVNTEPANTNVQIADSNTNSNSGTLPTPDGQYWQVETIAGTPTFGAGSGEKKLAVGEYLETDSRSRARIDVADIGSVEIAPNSRVKLVGTSSNEHRLSLDRGGLHAKIFAPPRLFVVDTPSGKAVDLGCEYTLEVDRNGDSKLHVKGGYVALERERRESIVPAGAMCLMRKGKGLGTPFSAEASPEFQAALTRFDFARGGSSAVKQVVEHSEFYDMVTLWHLLSRVGKADRETVFDALSKHVPPPSGVTKDGIVKLDKPMLEAWKAEVDNAWFQ